MNGMEPMEIAPSVALVAVLAALGWTIRVGVRRRDAAVAVNALASLCAAILPLAIEALASHLFDAPVSFGAVLPLCIGVAGVLHMLGMLGWYDELWWWDHVTHTASAALVAAVVYAWVIVAGPDTLPYPLSGESATTATLAITIGAGACWELLEWAARVLSERVGVGPVLEHYGRFDTPGDLAFDALGAILVVALDGRLFLPAFEPIPRVTQTLLYAWIGLLVVTSVISVVIVAYGRRVW